MNYRNFLRFYQILPFFYAEYWENGCRWALGLYFILKKLFKSFISGVKLFYGKNIRKVIEFWKYVQQSMKIPNFGHFWPNFGHFWPIFAIFFIFFHFLSMNCHFLCVYQIWCWYDHFCRFWGGGVIFDPPPELIGLK